MATFDESKHKRDELGRFAEMSSEEISNIVKQEIGDHKYIVAKDGRIDYSALTKRQWRLWYEEQTQRDKAYLLGEYEARRFVNVEGIFVLTYGDFDKPKVEAVYKFVDSEKTIRFKAHLDKYYG